MTTTLTSAADVPERNAIDPAYQWDLSVMYAETAAWDQHYREVDAKVTELAGLKGTADDGPEALLRLLKLRDEVNIQLEKLYAYAMMRHHQDMRSSAPQAALQRAQTLLVRYQESVAWLSPELLEIPEATLNTWLERDDLRLYRHFLDDLLRSRAHILNPREEALLAMSAKAVEASGDAYDLLTNTELRWRAVKDPQGNEVRVTPATFYQVMESKDRDFRRKAFLGYHESYLDTKATLAATLAGTMHRDWYFAKARNYETSLHRSLDSENLPVAVYHNLIRSIRAHLPLLHRYTALKKKALGIDTVHFYDLYVNLVDVPEKTYTFEQARDLVLEGVAPFGPEYGAAMRQAFTNRWIDVFENQGKQSGAYNMGTHLSPPFVLLNFKGQFGDVSTLAHELGHAMQSLFSQTQPPVYSGYPMFTAEVASTAAEIVFKNHVLQHSADPAERAYLINEMLENIRQTVFRQVKFAEFDLAAHTLAEQGEPMTADALMQVARQIHQDYYGPNFTYDDALDVECLRIPHYYRNYYVYRYATSFCAAAAIANRLQTDSARAVEDWMRFLRTGNSRYALDMLRDAGVDMTTPGPIEDCMALFDDLLGQLETWLADARP